MVTVFFSDISQLSFVSSLSDVYPSKHDFRCPVLDGWSDFWPPLCLAKEVLLLKQRLLLLVTRLLPRPINLYAFDNTYLLCVPEVTLLGWASLGPTIYLYCGLKFPTLGCSWYKDSTKLPLPLDSSILSPFPTSLWTFQQPLTSHIYSPKLVERLWLLPWLVQWEVQCR